MLPVLDKKKLIGVSISSADSIKISVLSLDASFGPASVNT